MFYLLFGIAMSVHLGPMAPDAPVREPQMVANGSTVALAFGAGKGIYFSSSTDAGQTFSPPVKIAEAEVIPLTRHRGPRIALAGRTIVITAVAGKTQAEGQHAHGLPSDGDLIAWRSIDGGKTWSKGILINDSPGAPTEGLHALGADAKGNLFAAWLDKRSGHGTTLYGARSTDGGRTWSKNIMIYQSPEGTICECCAPSVALDSGGQILVMWRNWLGGSRDMYLSRSRDGVAFSRPEKLGTGTWKLNACPMDGGGLVVSQNHLVSAWRRDHEVFVDTPGEPEVAIGEGVDVGIAAASNGVYVIWSTPTGIRALLPGTKEPVTLASKGTFPNIVALPKGHALAAWEDDGTIRIQEVSVPIVTALKKRL
jgi:hypothetical protein